RAQWRGGLHLVTQVVDEICEIFRELGFTRAVGPEIETERYNFYALNFPGPPRPGRPGLLLPGRGPAAANPHLARTDSHARALPAAHPGGDPGTGVPARPVRRLALAGFRAARGPRGGRGNHLRGLQGHVGRLRSEVLHRGHPGAVSPVVLPV